VPLPDPRLVLKRVDERLAARAGDDPLPDTTIAEFATAIQQQIIDPLSAALDGERRRAGDVPPPQPPAALEEEHVHAYPWPDLHGDPQPCTCGKTFPRLTADHHREGNR
jgi:hypothetical protein